MQGPRNDILESSGYQKKDYSSIDKNIKESKLRLMNQGYQHYNIKKVQ